MFKTALILVGLLAALPAAAGIIRVSDVQFRMIRPGRTIETWSWQTTVRNAGMGDLACTITANFLDRDGFIIVSSSERIFILGNQRQKVRGQTVTHRPSGIRELEVGASCR